MPIGPIDINLSIQRTIDHPETKQNKLYREDITNANASTELKGQILKKQKTVIQSSESSKSKKTKTDDEKNNSKEGGTNKKEQERLNSKKRVIVDENGIKQKIPCIDIKI